MKSIYKKISVGVLAAALLVGGSGILQGGQAFADFKVLDRDEEKLDEYLRKAEAKEPGFVGYVNLSDRRRVAKIVHKAGLEVMEADRSDVSEIYKEYREGWDLDDDIAKIKKIVESKNKCDVKVGNLYFRIKK